LEDLANFDSLNGGVAIGERGVGAERKTSMQADVSEKGDSVLFKSAKPLLTLV